jgi:dTDP-4-dehydrorhamnose 3,5-epimerase
VTFERGPIEGAYSVHLERVEDERGSFARSFCQDEFRRAGLDPCVAQCSVSFNRARGTLRGMHVQASPHEEAKLIRCSAGAIYDVVVDLRSGSPTFGQWWGVELTPRSDRMVYVPAGVAHGFQTLAADTEVSYQMSRPYAPDAATGVRWDDPAFAIEWPLEVTEMSAADRDRPDFAQA